MSASSSSQPHDVMPASRTTILLQNLPTCYTRTMLIGVFDTNGFGGQYDFLFVPIDANTNLSHGYAIINLISPLVAAQFSDTFNGFSRWWRSWLKEVCEVSWSPEEQGLDALLERYRNSPMMDPLVPDDFKPVRFLDGVRIAFPPPAERHALLEAEEPLVADLVDVMPANYEANLDALQELAAIARQEVIGGREPVVDNDALDAEEARQDLPKHHQCADDMRTTLVLKNLPGGYSREMLLGLFDNHGFMGQYDLIFLPIDFKTFENLGYAYLNFHSPLVAAQFIDAFQGFDRWWRAWCTAACEVSWSRFEQGYEGNIERYRNSPVMHESVPDMFKPAVFWNGVRQPFPHATKKIRAPRARTFPGKLPGDCSPFGAAAFGGAYFDEASFNANMAPFGFPMSPFPMAPFGKSHVRAK